MSSVFRSPDARLVLTALAMRLVPVAVLFLFTSTTWDRYLSTSDASSFIPVAKVLYGLEPLSSIKLYDTRVFPGWPLVLGLPLAAGAPEWSALALSLLCAAAAPVALYRLTGDLDLAWALVYFTPAWLLSGFHPISEAVYLLGILATLLALRAERPWLAGLLAGFLVVIRPFGIAWVAAIGIALLWRNPAATRQLARFVLGGLIPAVLLLTINARVFGDPLHQLHVYGLPLDQLNLPTDTAAQIGQATGHWDLPFKHVLLTPWLVSIPLWKVAYIYAHLIALVALIWIGVRTLPRIEIPWQRALALGFLLNAALIVSAGPYWGFHSFDRYFVWGLPGALWLARDYVPRRSWHGAVAIVSLALAVRALFGHAAT